MAIDDDFAEFSATTTIASVVTPVFEKIAIPDGTSSTQHLGPWYALWERHSLSDFYVEVSILAIIALIVFVHSWGVKANRQIAAGWMQKHAKVFAREFALLGFTPKGEQNTLNNESFDSKALVKENSPVEFVSYASGRQGIAFAHISFNLIRRNNPIALFGEYLASFLFESITSPSDTVTIAMTPFDGNESSSDPTNSKYDNFVFGIVNKRVMRRARNDRYDLSLTKTSEGDAFGLPAWTVVMSESNELSNIVISEDLKTSIKALNSSSFDFLIATDQPVDKPLKLEDAKPQKRIILRLSVNGGDLVSQDLVSAFIRFTDHLISKAHFRPEVLKKIRATRESQTRKLKQAEEQEKAEEREAKKAEEKRKERDAKLRSMSADEQKRFLEREKEKEQRKGLKKFSKRA